MWGELQKMFGLHAVNMNVNEIIKQWNIASNETY